MSTTQSLIAQTSPWIGLLPAGDRGEAGAAGDGPAEEQGGEQGGEERGNGVGELGEQQRDAEAKSGEEERRDGRVSAWRAYERRGLAEQHDNGEDHH